MDRLEQTENTGLRTRAYLTNVMTPTLAMSSSNSFHVSVSNSFWRVDSGSGGGSAGGSGGNSSSSNSVFCRLDSRLPCLADDGSSPVESCLENIDPRLVAPALPISPGDARFRYVCAALRYVLLRDPCPPCARAALSTIVHSRALIDFTRSRRTDGRTQRWKTQRAINTIIIVFTVRSRPSRET